jgi:hypothetical protein
MVRQPQTQRYGSTSRYDEAEEEASKYARPTNPSHTQSVQIADFTTDAWHRGLSLSREGISLRTRWALLTGELTLLRPSSLSVFQ